LLVLLAAGAVFFRNAYLPNSNHPKSSQAITPAPAKKVEPTKSTAITVETKSEPASNPSQAAVKAVSESDNSTIEIEEVLAESSSSGSLSSSFSNLLAHWGIKQPLKPSELGCKAAKLQGFDCLFLSGSWPKVRRYDSPAILEMVFPNDASRKRITLIGVNDDTASFLLGDKEYTFPISQIDRVWDGTFIIIWKPPFSLRQLSPGDHGPEIAWVSNALDRWEGKETKNPVSPVFDDALRKRIIAFQRDRSLIPDGYIGSETLVRLTLALEGQDAPSLSGHVQRAERRR